eukprot:1145971-Pelagomonas_calceolata.AAC.4
MVCLHAFTAALQLASCLYCPYKQRVQLLTSMCALPCIQSAQVHKVDVIWHDPEEKDETSLRSCKWEPLATALLDLKESLLARAGAVPPKASAVPPEAGAVPPEAGAVPPKAGAVPPKAGAVPLSSATDAGEHRREVPECCRLDGCLLGSWCWGADPCGYPAWEGVTCNEVGQSVSRITKATAGCLIMTSSL